MNMNQRLITTAAGLALALATLSCSSESPVSAGAAQDAAPPAAEAPSGAAKPAGKVCSGGGKATQQDVERVADAVSNSMFADSLQTATVRSMDDVTRGGKAVVLGRVVEVREVDLEPLALIPMDDGGAAPSFAGNTAYWSGVEIDVSHGSGMSTVQVPLVAGGADVIEASGFSQSAVGFGALDGACAVFVTGEAGAAPVLGGNRLVAVGLDERSRPIAVDGQFTSLVGGAASMKELATG
jgi:hypothetical protein